MGGGAPLADLLIRFYDYSILVLCLVIVMVSYVIFSFLFNSYTCKSVLEVQEVEIIWTVLPSFILFFFSFPFSSFIILNRRELLSFSYSKGCGASMVLKL